MRLTQSGLTPAQRCGLGAAGSRRRFSPHQAPRREESSALCFEWKENREGESPKEENRGKHSKEILGNRIVSVLPETTKQKKRRRKLQLRLSSLLK